MEDLEIAREKYRTHSVRWGFYWALMYPVVGASLARFWLNSSCHHSGAKEWLKPDCFKQHRLSI